MFKPIRYIGPLSSLREGAVHAVSWYCIELINELMAGETFTKSFSNIVTVSATSTHRLNVGYLQAERLQSYLRIFQEPNFEHLNNAFDIALRMFSRLT